MALSAVALVICVVATVKAGQVAPVFFWPTAEGADVVLTKRQYELGLAARQVGRLAAAAAVVLALAAITLTYRARKASRVR
jgi:ABC-type sugar transport system permease subunit